MENNQQLLLPYYPNNKGQVYVVSSSLDDHWTKRLFIDPANKDSANGKDIDNVFISYVKEDRDIAEYFKSFYSKEINPIELKDASTPFIFGTAGEINPILEDDFSKETQIWVDKQVNKIRDWRKRNTEEQIRKRQYPLTLDEYFKPKDNK